jgi:predicted type IV restriction endonuclease
VAVNYANTAGVDWCVLTNGNFWQIYRSNAPGDLDQKLFLETWLHSPQGGTPRYEPVDVLPLLSRQKLADNEIETRYRVLNVERRGEQALTEIVKGKDVALVRLVQKRSGLAKAEVIAFLDRARVTVETSPSLPSPAEDEKGGGRRGRRRPGPADTPAA